MRSGARHPADITRRDDAAALEPARRLLAAWAAAHAGTLVEDKGTALAVHYRRVPDLEAEVRRAAAAAAAAAGAGFHVQSGKQVFEVRSEAVDKGRAIEEFMAVASFVGRVPVFIGDDLTDEHGFDVVNRLGGHSVAVATARATLARWRAENESQVVRWLGASASGSWEDAS